MDQIKVRLTVTKEGCQADEDETPPGSQREDKHKTSRQRKTHKDKQLPKHNRKQVQEKLEKS